jgi:hypothetical protein
MCISTPRNNQIIIETQEFQIAELQISFDHRFIWINDVNNNNSDLDFWHVVGHNDNSAYMVYFTFYDWNLTEIPYDCVYIYNQDDCNNNIKLESWFARIIQTKCEKFGHNYEDYFDQDDQCLTLYKQH